MPSSSTNYSYDIPTVGSDSTTYGTIINQFVNSLATKLKAVSDAINTAGVGASSTLAQVNRNIAQVDAINSRIPVGVANLLPDPYSGATTPVSTWPYLNTELTAEGFSPPTTAQEVLDFDYSGFATYLNTRLDSLSARITGLDAAVSIHDTDQLVCEANTILNAIGTYKDVLGQTTERATTVNTFFDYTFRWRSTGLNYPQGFYEDFEYLTGRSEINQAKTLADNLYAQGLGSWSGSELTNNRKYTLSINANDIRGKVAAGETFDDGYYLQPINTPALTIDSSFVLEVFQFNGSIDVFGNVIRYPYVVKPFPGNYDLWVTYSGGRQFARIWIVKTTETIQTVTSTVQVPVTLNDIDFSGCS